MLNKASQERKSNAAPVVPSQSSAAMEFLFLFKRLQLVVLEATILPFAIIWTAYFPPNCGEPQQLSFAGLASVVSLSLISLIDSYNEMSYRQLSYYVMTACKQKYLGSQPSQHN